MIERIEMRRLQMTAKTEHLRRQAQFDLLLIRRLLWVGRLNMAIFTRLLIILTRFIQHLVDIGPGVLLRIVTTVAESEQTRVWALTEEVIRLSVHLFDRCLFDILQAVTGIAVNLTLLIQREALGQADAVRRFNLHQMVHWRHLLFIGHDCTGEDQ